MKKSTSNLLLGLLAGVAAGAALGILFAPEKGSVIRKQIKDKTRDLTGEMDDMLNELKEQVTGVMDDLKEKLSDAGTTSTVADKKPKTKNNNK